MIYKVLKPELFIADTKLLGKYKLWENRALNPTHICHSKTFGTKEDVYFGTENSFWCGFNTKNYELRIECSSFGGMCGFEFTREHLENPDLSKIDRDCMEYTFKFIDDLKENGVIGVNMEKVNISVDPRYIVKQMIYQIYEQNINQYKEDESLVKLKYATYHFLYNSGILQSDEYIDKICSNLTNEDTLEIENTNEFKYNLWKSLINSDEYINFINRSWILTSGTFDKKYNREYEANFGEHFLSILSALKDAGVDESQYDDYIEKNLIIYGANYTNSKELIPLLNENKIKPVNKRKIVNDYQEKHWIEKHKENL